MSKDMLFLIPFFCRAFTGAGTAKRDYSEVAEFIDLYTGGIGISPHAGTGFNEKEKSLPFLALQGKALDRNIDHLFDLVTELVSQYSFKDLTRLKSMLFQYRSGLESSIVSQGHRYAMSLAARNLTQSSFIGEMWHGVSQFQFIKTLTEKIEKEGKGEKYLLKLSQDLDSIAQSVFKKGNLRSGIVGGKNALILADSRISTMLDSLPETKEDALKSPEIEVEAEFPYEGWMTSTAVSFVSQAFKTVRLGHEDAPCLSVISKILRSLYLHREIREKGGAYGGFAIYNSEEGIFSFGSYRDPNIVKTLDVYKASCDFIMDGDYSEDDIKEAILQVCSDIDKPETPGPSAIKAFYRDIVNLTDAKRDKFKSDLLKLDKKAIVKASEKYFKVKEKEKGTAVISSREKLEESNLSLNKDSKPMHLFKI